MGDPSLASSFEAVDPSRYSTVAWLQSGQGEGEEDDSSLLASVFALKQALSAHGESASTPRLVSEVASPSMKDLILTRFPNTYTDVLLPNELASGILVQFALQPSLRDVYWELLQAEGKEIYIAPLSAYMAEGEEIDFSAIRQRARANGEVALGYRRAGERPTLNPRKKLVGSINGGGLRTVPPPSHRLALASDASIARRFRET